MENLIICSKVLYDMDVANKMKEITSLNNRIANLEKEIDSIITPKILCNDHTEWHRKITYILEYIYDNISNLQFVDTGGDAELLTGPSLWMISDRQIKSELFTNVLIWLTGNEKWSHNVVAQIMADLKSILDLLKIHEKYNETEIREFVYYFIHDKLCERHKYSVLADIPQYRCKKCGILYNDPYDSEDDGVNFEITEVCDSCYGID